MFGLKQYFLAGELPGLPWFNDARNVSDSLAKNEPIFSKILQAGRPFRPYVSPAARSGAPPSRFRPLRASPRGVDRLCYVVLPSELFLLLQIVPAPLAANFVRELG